MKNLPLSETTLIELARAGDVDAFTMLVETHADRLYRALRSFALNAEEAEEVAQEVFVRAWRAIGRFEGRSQFSTWLYRIAFNEAQRWLSRRPRHAGTVDLTDQDIIDAVPDQPRLGPDARALDRELQATIASALAQVPAPWQAAVILRDIEGLSTEEAAAATGIRVAAFKSRLHRGRMELRSLLEPYLAVESQTTPADGSARTDTATTPRPSRTAETAAPARVQAFWNHTVLADSSETIVVDGSHYFPRRDVNHQHLEAISQRSTCSSKGVASYYDVVVSNDRNPAAAWFYPDPEQAVAAIRDYVAFWKGVEVRSAELLH
jgi:RNA polymerase sigma-70 factor, ECF subfamily